jgi:predicted kinase
MCGLPFSGKTYLAKRLSQKNDCLIVSIDDIRESLGFYWDKHEAHAEDWDKIFKLVNDKIAALLKAGNSVIYDSANQDKASRDRFSKLAKDLSCDYKIIFINTPLEVIQERRRNNLTSHDRFDLPEKYFKAALATFEPPSKEERNVVTY